MSILFSSDQNIISAKAIAMRILEKNILENLLATT
jgi:hypothetical protein